MKIIKLITLLLIATFSYSQERTSIGFGTEPNAVIKDGFNAYIDITHEIGYGYIAVKLFAFPNLNNIGYYSVTVSGGINLTAGYFEEHRFYLGGVLGLSRRLVNNYPLAGYEAGYDYWVSKKIALSLNGSVHYRSDAEFYKGAKNVFNGSIGLKIRIDGRE